MDGMLRSTIPNARLMIYEDAGHSEIFQCHEDVVRQALAFLVGCTLSLRGNSWTTI